MHRQSTFAPLLAFILAGTAIGCALASAGVVTGTVRAHGAETPGGDDTGAGNYGSRRYKFLERVDYDELAGFVVYVDQAVPEPSAAVASSPVRARAAQRDGVFVPRVLAVAPGTVVEFPNEDEIFHNVFSMSETTPFDLGLYKRGEPAKEIVFRHPGRVDVFCSIHTKMNCVVLVVPNRWFALADARGRWRLPALPAGTYRLRAWHERMPSRFAEVTVPAEGEVRVDFVLGFSEPARP